MRIPSLFVLAFGIPAFVSAQPGALDPTFSEGDLGFGFGDGAISAAVVAEARSDGYLLVAGGFGRYDDIVCNLMVALDGDGHPYEGFLNTTFMGNRIEDLVVLPDDRVVVCGSFTNKVRRFLPTGTLDATFNIGDGPNDYAFTINQQTDGRLIVGGQFTTFDGVPRGRIARLLADGALDTSFDPGTGADGWVKTSAIQADGRIIIAGDLTQYNGTAVNHIARLMPDGQLDATFQVGTGFNLGVAEIALLPDGRILACGSFDSYNGVVREQVAVLQTDGSLDMGFNAGNISNSVDCIAVGPDNTIYIGGGLTEVENYASPTVTRLLADGTVDASFNTGLGGNAGANGLLVLDNGQLLVLGGFQRFGTYPRNRVVLLNADGSVDAGFGDGTGLNGRVNAVAVQADQRVLVGGQFVGSYGDLDPSIERLEEDGDPDPAFSTDFLRVDYVVQTIAPRSDGRTVLGGRFDGSDQLRMLDATGAVDPTYDVAFTGSTTVFSAIHQADGNLLIGGSFTALNTVARRGVARLNEDWTLDSGFDPGTGLSTGGVVYHMALQPDGRLVIVGNFTTYNGNAADGIARLNADGSFDASFLPGVVGSGYPKRVAVQNDGKLLVCASASTTYNGTAVGYLFRLNSDGTLDGSWQDGTGPSDVVNDLVVEASGHVVIVGDFTLVNSTARGHIARLQPNGELDPVFLPTSGANGPVRAVHLLDNGMLLIGGEFTAYDGVGRNRIARVQNDITSGVPQHAQASSGYARALGDDRFFVPMPAGNGAIRIDILDAAGRTIAYGLVPGAYENGLVVRSPISLSAGLYYLQVNQGNERIGYPVLVQH